MAPNGYFVRVRGKVMGPFSLKQLQSLRDRGQFRGFHEVSEDRATWRSASSIQGFFAPEPPAAAPAAPPAGPPRQSAEEWFYVNGRNEELGPVSSGHLRRLHDDGIVRDHTQVWKRGNPEWTTYSESGLKRDGSTAKSASRLPGTGSPLRLFFANPIAGLPQMAARFTPAGAAWTGYVFYLVFLLFVVVSILLSGLVHKTQVFRNIQDLANSPDRFEIVAKLILLAFLPLVSLWGTIAILRLITRSQGNLGADGLISGATFLVPALLMPLITIFVGVSDEVVVFLIILMSSLAIMQHYAAFSQTLRLPDQGIIFAIPAAALLNGWLLKTMIQLLFRVEATRWNGLM